MTCAPYHWAWGHMRVWGAAARGQWARRRRPHAGLPVAGARAGIMMRAQALRHGAPPIDVNRNSNVNHALFGISTSESTVHTTESFASRVQLDDDRYHSG